MRFEKVVCTGGSGRLGRYVIEELRGRYELTVADLVEPETEVGFAKVDVTDRAALAEVFAGQEALLHLAAIPNPRTASPEVTMRINVMGTWAVLDAAEQAKVRRVVVTSSDAALGLLYNPPDWSPQYLPVDEDHPLRPTEFYSLSKTLTENVAQSYAYRGLEVVVIRPTHMVFPAEYPEIEERGADVNNYHLWTYVAPEDVARAFRLTLEKPESPYSTYLISAADGLNTTPTLEMIEKRYGTVPEIRRPGYYDRNPTASVLDITRAREELGYEPRHDWRDMLTDA